MRAQTKIGVGVGAVLIVVGYFYFWSHQNKPAQQLVLDNTATDSNGADPVPPVASTPPADVMHAPVVDNSVPSVAVASPASKEVDLSKKFEIGGENPRPQPSATVLPIERSGLSSLPPTLPSDVGTDASATPAVTDVPSAAHVDMPPNVVDKQTPLPAPVTTVVEPPSSITGSTRIMSTPPIAATPSKPGATKTHVIVKNDTYTSLAVKYLGHAKYAKLIEKANPGRDAAHLYIGAKVNIPEAPAATAATPGTPATPTKAGTAAKSRAKVKEVVLPPDPSRAYVVQPGDSWYSMARKFLGKGEENPRLYELNKERVDGNPNLLRPGMVIELPPGAKMPAKTNTTTPTPAAPATPAR